MPKPPQNPGFPQVVNSPAMGGNPNITGQSNKAEKPGKIQGRGTAAGQSRNPKDMLANAAARRLQGS